MTLWCPICRMPAIPMFGCGASCPVEGHEEHFVEETMSDDPLALAASRVPPIGAEERPS